MQQVQGLGAVQRCITDQIAALLRGLEAAQVAINRLAKGAVIVAVATERLQVHRQAGLILTDQLQDHLIELWPMVTAVSPHQLQPAGLFAIGAVIGAIDVKAGDIKMHRRGLEPQLGDHLLGHHLIKRRHIGRKQRIQTAPEHIIIKVIGAEPGADQSLDRLVGEELREHAEVLAYDFFRFVS